MSAITTLGSPRLAQEVGVTAVSRRTAADFSIVTAEGDKVTLSLNSAESAGAYRYSAQGRLEGGTQSAVAAGSVYESSTSLSLSIQGELSKEEIRDIQKAIKTVAKVYRDLAKGDEEQAVKRASKLDKLDSIAELAASISVSEAAFSASRVSIAA
jgi:hypothetical protein